MNFFQEDAIFYEKAVKTKCNNFTIVLSDTVSRIISK